MKTPQDHFPTIIGRILFIQTAPNTLSLTLKGGNIHKHKENKIEKLEGVIRFGHENQPEINSVKVQFCLTDKGSVAVAKPNDIIAISNQILKGFKSYIKDINPSLQKQCNRYDHFLNILQLTLQLKEENARIFVAQQKICDITFHIQQLIRK